MAVTFDALGGPTRIDNLSVAGATTSHSHTCTGSNRYLAHLVAIRRLTLDIASGSYNGVAYTELAQRDQGTSNRAIVYGLVAPATGAHTAALVSTGTSADDIAHGTISFNGVDQVTPVKATAVIGGTNPSVTLATDSGGMVIVCISYQVETDNPTPPATSGTWTQRFQSTGSGDASFHAWTAPADGATWTIDPDGSGTSNLAVVAVSLSPAAGAGTATRRGMLMGVG